MARARSNEAKTKQERKPAKKPKQAPAVFPESQTLQPHLNNVSREWQTFYGAVMKEFANETVLIRKK
ncbi:hypothetical protein LSG31_10830 [Fodinisporobacter ferrooxydans]|uniref:Uncharacterized protein n=1 Tax=Fodinisporobacter ferrooxydans TaxID=2901836 RepID=A0ABY4CT44_9BACL|nr:hypothetical protein LSG31_10830 [Alicyclobacillaceae bacterium MYW30-H2]